MAVGMAADLAHDLLFVAGGFTGQGYVYDLRTGATVASYQFAAPGPRWSTTWQSPRTAPVHRLLPRPALLCAGHPGGGPGADVRTLAVSGPAAAISPSPDVPNLNGIQATPNGKTLIVAHSANAQLYTVDPATGASAAIAGVSVPNVDGIVLEAGRLWAVQNFSNQVSRIRPRPDLSSGVVEEVITSPLFQVPTTAARFGSRLAVVNAKFDTGIPPTADQYEVIVVNR